MTADWISPWSGERLAANDLIREVALDALSQVYLVTILGFPPPDISLGPDTVSVTSAALGYEYVIPYPAVLAEPMARGFSDSLLALRREFGLLDGAREYDQPRGDAIGAMLGYYKAADRLIRVVGASRCWNPHRVFALHGLPVGHTPDSLITDLDAAGFHYLVMYPITDVDGSGGITVVDMPTAIALINALWQRTPGAVEALFDTDRSYGPHHWFSDDNRWHVDESAEADQPPAVAQNDIHRTARE